VSTEIERIYTNALSFAEYYAHVSTHVDAFRDHYQGLAFVTSEEEGKSPLGTSRILVLTEDYCIDSVLNVPLVARLVEASPGAELRLARRHEYPGVAERFPGRGGVSRLPTVIFLDQPGGLPGFWSERSGRDHQWMADFLTRDPMPELKVENGQPAPVLAEWMARRFAAQRPFFESESWKNVRDELHSIAQNRAACTGSITQD
jgi:hypothetical protein